MEDLAFWQAVVLVAVATLGAFGGFFVGFHAAAMFYRWMGWEE